MNSICAYCVHDFGVMPPFDYCPQCSAKLQRVKPPYVFVNDTAVKSSTPRQWSGDVERRGLITDRRQRGHDRRFHMTKGRRYRLADRRKP